MIAGIILAAGAARRMGQPKQLLPLDGKPMVWHVANAACQSRLDSVVLVTGAAADAVAAAIRELPVTIIHNANWKYGQATSLTVAVRMLGPDTNAVMFLLADQPAVTPALINSLIDTYHNSEQSIICPFYAGQPGTPVLFDWEKWKSALITLSGDQGARKIIAAHPEAVRQVSVDSGELLWDVDTEEDYRRMCDVFRKTSALPKILDQ